MLYLQISSSRQRLIIPSTTAILISQRGQYILPMTNSYAVFGKEGSLGKVH